MMAIALGRFRGHLFTEEFRRKALKMLLYLEFKDYIILTKYVMSLHRKQILAQIFKKSARMFIERGPKMIKLQHK